MIAVLGTTKYLSTYACGPRGAAHYRVATYDGAPPPRAIKVGCNWSARPAGSVRAGAPGPGHLRIEPVRPGSADVTITLDP